MAMKGKMFVLALLLGGSFCLGQVPGRGSLESRIWNTLRWRSVGPSIGGRVTAVTGVPGDRLHYFMGAAGGGVWRTSDGGLTWWAVSDRFLGSLSVGALAVAPSAPYLVFAGTGESCLRNDITEGDGIYRSRDGGDSWERVGLEDSRHIARIRVHPRRASLVYAAVLGNVYGPGGERGVYRSRDAGEHWQRVLWVDQQTGAADLALDPLRPSTLFAAMWQVRIRPWAISSGGPGSGLYRSRDGGEHWEKLRRGLPDGPLGRIGVAVSRVKAGRVWALVEALRGGGLFLSEDGGESFRLVNDDFQLRRRPYYYSHVFADPKEADTVYVLTSPMLRSVDAGRTFRPLPVPHGDTHDLWIDPEDPGRMILGSDGGANVSTNGGQSWTPAEGQTVGQFYKVAVDGRFPYRIYGSQQDMGTVSLPSRRTGFSLVEGPDRYSVGGGESGSIAVSRRDPEIVYAGTYWGRLTRFDHATGEVREISVDPDLPLGRPAALWKARFNWTFPLVLSRHAGHALYAGGNRVFRSLDEGQSWEAISPDLTRNLREKLRQGRLTQIWGTLTALAESPLQPGLLWAGSDDGRVQLGRGGNWKEVTPPALPQPSRIVAIAPSFRQAGLAYLAAERHDLDDRKPYLFLTRDFGASWEPISEGIPEGAFLRVVREDPVHAGLLFAGTERGVFASLDGGRHWQSLRLELPVVPVYDLVLQGEELVAATHGRSLWVLRGLGLLAGMGRELQPRVHLFQPAPAYRARGFGADIYYRLEAPARQLTLAFLDARGRLVRSFRGRAGERQVSLATLGGLHRFHWDLRYPPARGIEGGTHLFAASLAGPRVLPGDYQVRLEVDGTVRTRTLTVRGDPRRAGSPEDRSARFEMLLAIRDALDSAHEAVNRILRVKARLERARERPDLRARIERLRHNLDALLGRLVELRFRGIDDQMLQYPLQLNNRIAVLARVVASSRREPTEQVRATFRELEGQLREARDRLQALLEGARGWLDQLQ